MRAKHIYWLIMVLMLMQTVYFFYFQARTPFHLHSEALPTVYVSTENRGNKAEPALEVFHKPDPDRLVQSAPIVDLQQVLVPAKDNAPPQTPPARQPVPQQQQQEQQQPPQPPVGGEAKPNLEELDEPQRGAREFGFKLKEDASHLTQKARDASLNVFVVPHSHCDAGWLKTFDEYHRQEVQHILTTVTEALSRRADRKFSWVEVGFLDKWWRVQNEQEKKRFRGLFESGQLEFLMGGWVSHDEATVTYMQAINQMTAGHTYLQREFGPRAIPRVGWQIDPFGLSQVTATLFSQMCFDADAAWRTCQGTDMKDFVDNKLLEFIWRGSPTLESSSDLLLHLLPWSYVAPPEFLFEKPGALAVNSETSIAHAAQKLVDSFKERASYFPSNTLMWLWGHDFQFVNAHKMFDSMDPILDYINAHRDRFKVQVQYGTPTEYFQALQEEQVRFPLLVRDFLPYGPTEVNWWVGFYTSRPLLKRMCRYLDDIQRTAEVLYTWGRTTHKSDLPATEWTSLFHKLEAVRHVQGIMQHHDAITGTMREHVLMDYYHMLDRSNVDALTVIESMSALLSTASSSAEGVHALRPQETVTAPTAQEGVPYMVVNSLAWRRTEVIELFVSQPRVQVYDPRAQRVIPSSVLPPILKSDGEATGFRLYFALELESVGYRVVELRSAPDRTFEEVSITQSPLWAAGWRPEDMPGVQVEPQPASDFHIANERIRLDLDHMGQLTRISQPGNEGRTMSLKKEFWRYGSDSAWDNHYTFKASDAGHQVGPSSPTFYVVRTPLVQEVISQVSAQLLHRFTLKQGQSVVQVTDMVGPPTTGTNYVTRFATDLPTDGHFYTDDSGLEIVTRTYDSKRIYSANYYPLVFSSFLRTDQEPLAPERAGFQQFSVVVDRTHGVTSSVKGALDILLHRNSLQPFGNGEKMDDKNRVEMTSWLLVTPEDNYLRQQWAMRANFAPALVQLPPTNALRSQRAFLSGSLPDSVFLTNLEYYTVDEETVTLRVNNLRQNAPFEMQQGAAGRGAGALEQTISLARLFAQGGEAHLMGLEERSLSLNQPAQACKRHHWHDEEEVDFHPFRYGDILPPVPHAFQQEFTLTPLAIRSFFAHFAK